MLTRGSQGRYRALRSPQQRPQATGGCVAGGEHPFRAHRAGRSAVPLPLLGAWGLRAPAGEPRSLSVLEPHRLPDSFASPVLRCARGSGGAAVQKGRDVIWKLLLSLKFWLAVIYPAVSLVTGVVCWAFVALTMPGEPHPGRYGVACASFSLAGLYVRAALAWRTSRLSRKDQK